MITDSHGKKKKNGSAAEKKFSLHISCPFEIKLDFMLSRDYLETFLSVRITWEAGDEEKLSFSSFTIVKLHTCHDNKIY